MNPTFFSGEEIKPIGANFEDGWHTLSGGNLTRRSRGFCLYPSFLLLNRLGLANV